MPKSTITIEEKDGHITFTLDHEPEPEGPSENWSLPARAAQLMMDLLREDTERAGMNPTYRKVKNTQTGHTSIETREQMWRVRTSAGVSGPQPIEQLNVPVTIKLGAGHTYEGTVTVKRIRGRENDFPEWTHGQ